MPTTGEEGPSEGYTCVAEESIASDYDPSCNAMALDPEYLQAICATTFGGTMSDYMKEPVGGWIAELEDYPVSGNEEESRCDVTQTFDNTGETPTATDMVPLSTGQLDRCDRDSYCETLAKIIELFEPDPEDLAPDPWCNVSPGEENEPGPWRCVGSASVGMNGACGFVYVNDPICPRPEPGGKDYCVIATDEVDASEKCETVCDKEHTLKLDVYDTDYTTYFDCDVYDSNEMVWVSDVLDECFNPDQKTTTTSEPFHFEADLTLDNGGQAASDSIANLGVIEYSIENCVGTTCDITIEDLELSYALYSGTFYDDEETPFPYSVDGVRLHLVKPVEGVMTTIGTSPTILAFNSEQFTMHLTTGVVELDNVSLGAVGPLTLPITQVIGTYSSGALTLFITYETVDATMFITFTTMP